MSLVTVSAADAVAFVQRHHYSKTAVPGTVRWGWQIDGQLAGVSILDTGTHQVRSGVFGPEHYEHVLHHHRLALHPDAPRFSASQFIGATLRALRRDRPDVWAIVTYADQCQGHTGAIYAATNAVYTGLVGVGNLEFRTRRGEVQTTQSLARHGSWPERREEAARRGWSETRCLGKHRYIYLLGTAAQRRSRPPVLWPTMEPYPSSFVTSTVCQAPRCGARFEQPATGRRRRFCSVACRVWVHRLGRAA